MASRALRSLALAYRDDDGAEPRIDENNLTFAGLVGMIDPPREEVKQAVVRCRQAGIQPVMITGDHPATATAIARELGIASETDRVVSGQELDAMSDDDLATNVERIAVFARVAPEHKLRVVRAWKRRGEIVAMTGDGVNDASIVNAVEEGRAIYDNIQKFLIYLLSCNAGELMLMLVASLLGWPIPLLPVQLLWINLVTDGLPALALAMEPPEPGLMRRRPQRSSESMLSWSLGGVVLGQGALLAAVGLVAFRLNYQQDSDLDQARTMTFCVVVYAELFRALAARSRLLTFWQLGAATNWYLFAAVVLSGLLQAGIVSLPFTRAIFNATNHTPMTWGLVFALALTPVTVIELVKLGRQFFGRCNPPRLCGRTVMNVFKSIVTNASRHFYHAGCCSSGYRWS